MAEKEEKRPGPSEGLESEGKEQEQPELTLQETIAAQTRALLALDKRLDSMEKHQDQTDEAIIEVAKKVGSSGGGGLGGVLAQIAPYLGPRGPGPLEKIAMNMFLRNMAFTSLTTERLAKRQFGDEYTKMVQEMEAEISGVKTER